MLSFKFCLILICNFSYLIWGSLDENGLEVNINIAFVFGAMENNANINLIYEVNLILHTVCIQEKLVLLYCTLLALLIEEVPHKY